MKDLAFLAEGVPSRNRRAKQVAGGHAGSAEARLERTGP